MKRFQLCIICLFVITLSTFAQSSSELINLSRADTLRGMLSSLRTCYDINYYHLDIKVDIEQKFISGSNQFSFTATQDFQKLQFDLFDNYDIEKITYQDTDLTYTTDFDAVFIEFPQMIKKGTKATFTVYYSGTPIIAQKAPWDGGFVFKEDQQGAPWVAVACQGLGASSWWPTKDHQADEVDSMLISITVPRGLQNISNGRLRSKEIQPDGTTKFNWFVSYPINNYNVTLNIGDFEHFSEEYMGEKGKLSLDYYVLPENLEKAKKQFADVKPMLTCFEHWFGPYPFYNDGYKLIESPYLGMEHQSAIAYGNNYQKGYFGNDLSKTGFGLSWDFIIVHESAHEWFGNNITSKDIADMWIHEAFATYSESLFVECQQGKEAAINYLNGERKLIKHDFPVIGPYQINKKGSGDMYFKGANLLHTVRTIINDDEKWRRILRGLNYTFGLKTVTTTDIVSYINKLSGKDLSKVFDQYLNYTSIPVLELSKTSAASLAYRWKADVKNFNMPIRVKLPDAKSWRTLTPGATFKKLNTSAEASNLIVDTNNSLIEISTLGN